MSIHELVSRNKRAHPRLYKTLECDINAFVRRKNLLNGVYWILRIKTMKFCDFTYVTVFRACNYELTTKKTIYANSLRKFDISQKLRLRMSSVDA